MAANRPQGQAVAGHNYVGQDQIWKDHVHLEEDAARKWDGNWSFMKTKYTDLVKDDFPERKGPSSKDKLQSMMQVKPVTPLAEIVDVRPSVKPVPVKTSQEVGWRSTDKVHQLEKYGGYARPKGSLIKSLKWPVEAIN